ncbi:MAG: methionine adenosyltransferase [Acidimicrobiia bacterium]
MEFVERKGTGHPDTICDQLAEDCYTRLVGCDREAHRWGIRAVPT